MRFKGLARVIVISIVAVLVLAAFSFAQEKDADGKLVGKALLSEKCSTCQDKAAWEEALKGMKDSVSEKDAKEITWFLDSKAIFDTKCSKCHPTTRPLGKTKNRADWEMTVKRMGKKRPGWISEDEEKRIIDFIFTERGK
jgi:cytochrome c5